MGLSSGLLSCFWRSLYNFARGGVLCFRRVFYRLSVVSRRGGACVASFGGFLRSLVPFAVPGWLLHRFRDPLHVRQLFRLCGFARFPFWLHIWPAMGFYFVLWVLVCLWAFRRSVGVSCVRFDFLWKSGSGSAFGRGYSVEVLPGFGFWVWFARCFFGFLLGSFAASSVFRVQKFPAPGVVPGFRSPRRLL